MLLDFNTLVRIVPCWYSESERGCEGIIWLCKLCTESVDPNYSSRGLDLVIEMETHRNFTIKLGLTASVNLEHVVT